VITELKFAGMIPDVGIDKYVYDKEGQIIYKDYCGNPDHIDPKYNCNNVIMPSIYSNFNKTCKGLKYCSFSINDNIYDYTPFTQDVAGFCYSTKTTIYI